MQQHVRMPAGTMRHLLRRMFGWLLTGIFLLGLGWVGSPLFERATAQETETQVHTVQAGETLSEIAQSYGVTMDAVMRLNGITNADAIFVGQRLRIPEAPTPTPPVEPESVGEQPAEVTTANEPEPAESEIAESEDETNLTRENTDNATSAPVPLSVPITTLNPTYTVRTGDTLARIALRYDIDLTALQAINQLPSGATLRAGQQMILPATRDELRFAPDPIRYTVQPGDSLGLIAQRHETTLGTLMTLNRISNPDLIQPGQELAIPLVGSSESAPRIGPALSGFYYHTVRVGETPSELAQQFNSTPQALVRYNGLPDMSTLFSGLEVRIPYGPPILNRRMPPTPRSGTEFVISISRQRCWVMQGDQVRHEWKCSTGQGEWVTRTGTFPIQSKFEIAKSSAYRLDMPYWLGLYDVGAYENGIHGIPIEWSTGEKLWDTLVGQPATFGCAMLLDDDAKTLFDLAYIGMPVHIVD